MSKKFSFAIILLIFLPGVLLSQNVKVNELFPFVAIENGDYSLAIDSLNQLISKQPEIEFYNGKINALYHLKRFQEALDCCDQMDRISQNSSIQHRIKLHMVLNNKDAVISTFNEASNSKYKIKLYDLLHHDDYLEIRKSGILESLLSGNTYSIIDKQLYQVERLFYSKKYTQAIFLVDELISKQVNLNEAYFLQSKISFQLGDFKKANEAIQKAISIKSLNSDYWLQQSLIQKELDLKTDALYSIEKTIRIKPYSFDQYVVWLELLVWADDNERALKIASQLEALKPNDAAVLFYRAKSLFRLGDNLEALKSINRSMQFKSSKESFELRGDIYSATGTFEFAIRDYSMVLDIEAFNANVYVKKALARFNSGDQQGACADWQKAKRYGSYEAIRYLEKYCK